MQARRPKHNEAWERGISNSDNPDIRSIAIEIALEWLRYQSQSTSSRWYEECFGQIGEQIRRISIIVVARKLFIDLWRYLETCVIPEGAELKPLLGYFGGNATQLLPCARHAVIIPRELTLNLTLHH